MTNLPKTQFLYDRPDSVCMGKSALIGSRKEQQDTIVTDNDLAYSECGRAIAILCDGMGGLKGGSAASQICASNLFHAFHAMPAGTDIRNFFKGILPSLDREVASLKNPDGSPLHAGTTLVTVAVNDGKLFLANVGDSHAYFIRNGEISTVSRDHNFLNVLLEEAADGKISIQDAYANPKKEALVSYLGMNGLMAAHVPEPLNGLLNEDTVVLCSDGLYRSLTDREILQTVLKHESDVQAAAEEMTSMAVAKGIRTRTTPLLWFCVTSNSVNLQQGC